jgi:arginyl-tRNA synthetase
MLKLKKLAADAIVSALSAAYPGAVLTAEDAAAMFEYPPDPSMGDIAFPCFKLSKMLRAAPPVIASKLAEVYDCAATERVSAVGGYLNMFVSSEYLTGDLLARIENEGADYGKPHLSDGQTVVLDYSSPNVAKPFHIGHLGTTVIGHSLKLLHEFAGYKCVGINYLGDWGRQFGLLIVAYRRWGDRAKVEEGGADELVSLYVRVNNEMENDPTIMEEARDVCVKLEHGDKECLELWRWIIDISLKEYEKTYKQLGITFDSYRGESYYTDKMPAEIEKLRKLDLLKIDDGASIVDLSEYNMPPCLILRRDGVSLYPTRDIAAAYDRAQTYNFEKCIYVTSSAQCLHFAQWFKVVELMGYPWAKKLVHVPYGTVSINGAKLATRTGNVILLKDLFNAAIERVTEIINEKNPNLPDKEATAEAVGVGAIVFYYLSGSRIKDINFVMEDALSFDGNTGPYAQYTYARTCSILEKAGGVDTGAPAKLTAPEEAELLKTLSLFEERVRAAINEYEPSVVTRYILDVCAAFNRFYHDCPILSVNDPDVRSTRIRLVAATKTVLGSALRLICIKTPEKI